MGTEMQGIRVEMKGIQGNRDRNAGKKALNQGNERKWLVEMRGIRVRLRGMRGMVGVNAGNMGNGDGNAGNQGKIKGNAWNGGWE